MVDKTFGSVLAIRHGSDGRTHLFLRGVEDLVDGEVNLVGTVLVQQRQQAALALGDGAHLAMQIAFHQERQVYVQQDGVP